MLDVTALPGQLEAFVSAQLGRSVTLVDFTPITGGYSRFMARFHVRDGDQELGFVMRADPPPGQSILDTDRAREWELLTALRDASFGIPTIRWYDEHEAFGTRAFLMDELKGDTLFTLLQTGDADDHRQYTPRLAELVGGIHTFDTSALPPTVDRPVSWDSYIDGCIVSWLDAAAVHVEQEPFMHLVAAWLDANRPPEAPLMLVHGDLQAPNILVERETGVFHMLDWEIARIGDPREDLGWWALACASQPPDMIADDADAFYAAYREVTGLGEDVVNPATVAYFTVLSSAAVFFNLIKQTAAMSREETTAMSIAYMTNAMPFMHGVWIDSMRKAGAWGKEAGR